MQPTMGSGGDVSFDEFMSSPVGQQWAAAQIEAAGWDREKFRKTMEFSKYQFDNMSADQKAQLGLSRERLGLDKQRLELDAELGRGRLRNETLRTEIDLRSTPANWLKLSQWRAGQGANNNGAIAAVQNLANGTRGPAFNAPGPGGGGSYDPRQEAANALVMANPPSDQPGASGQDQATLGAIANLYAQGGHKTRYSDWMAMSDMDKSIVAGGIAGLGGSPEQFQQDIRRSRIGQGGSGSFGPTSY